MPKRVIVGLLENSAINGQYNLIPFFFSDHDVYFLSTYIDWQPIPSKPLELNFSEGNYIAAYYRLFPGFNRDNGNYLSGEDYAKGHTL